MASRPKSPRAASVSEPLGYATFATALGPMGIAWTRAAVALVQLPEKDDRATLSRLRARLPRAGTQVELAQAPAWLRRTVAAIQRHLAGTAQDLSAVPLALDGVAGFRRRVYEAARRVPSGQTVTYGDLSRLAGSPGASRAVGSAMASNPFPMLVPCHRVVGSGGKPGGFTARGGVATKARILAIEGVPPHATAASNGAARKASTASSAGFTGAPATPETARDAAPRRAAPSPHARAVRYLAAADPKLGAMMARVGPCRLERRSVESPFETLLEAIVHQQLTGKAAQTILVRVKALFPRSVPTPERLAAIPDPSLRAAGLSGSKTASLKDLAARALAGEIPDLATLEGLADEEIIERLSLVRGIGRWTVEMLLLFHLGRPDVLPATDYGVRKGFARTFTSAAARRRAVAAGEDLPLPPPAELLAYGERWRPHRSVASWYLWRCLDLPG